MGRIYDAINDFYDKHGSTIMLYEFIACVTFATVIGLDRSSENDLDLEHNIKTIEHQSTQNYSIEDSLRSVSYNNCEDGLIHKTDSIKCIENK